MIFTPIYMQVVTLTQALKIRGNNTSELARELGLNRGTLREYLKRGDELYCKVTTEDSGEISLNYINK